MGDVGIDRWLNEGPRAGGGAPAFNPPTLDGERVDLESLLGWPVILGFGSYTCPIFCGQIPAMEDVASRHPEAVFLVIYTREAHLGEVTPEHRGLEAKRAAARRLNEEEPISRTILIDDLDGNEHRAYGPAWKAYTCSTRSRRLCFAGLDSSRRRRDSPCSTGKRIGCVAS